MRIGSRPARLAIAGLLSLACMTRATAAPAGDAAAPVATPVPAAPAKTFSVKSDNPPATPVQAPASKPAASGAKAGAAAKPTAPAKAADKPAVASAKPDAPPAPTPVPGQAYVKPYPGSRQTERSNRNFDEYWMPLGKLAGESQADKVARIEGRWIHGAYVTPAGPSVAEVFRHYEQQIARAGLQVEYSCNGVECGEGGRKTNGDWWWLSDNRRYLAARLARPNGDLWVAVHVHARVPTAPVVQEIDVIEVRPPVVPPAPRNEAEVATLEKELKAGGRVVLRQIAFAEGRATVLPQSEPVVKAIADLLSRDPGLKLYLVAHSDDSGPWNASMDLTKKRANAVALLLTHKYKVRSGRVQAAGVGPLAPVASNMTEDGRAQNRRIELLPQGSSRAGGPAAAARR